MNDQYEGRGGSYAINEAGERVLISRTEEPGAAPPAAITPTEPASAGFFTPVAPADSTHQETE